MSFSNVDYWDTRFRTEGSDGQSFDWLLPETCFDAAILEALSLSDDSQGHGILHIGSGTSLLSFHLSKLIRKASEIHNVDFSREAVEWGRAKEEELGFAKGGGRMKWSQMSLLSMRETLGACEPKSVSLIIDKSTSDAMSCGSDLNIRVPIPPTDDETIIIRQGEKTEHQVHPLNLLALNLAALAVEGARWLCLSYSSDRFPFLPALFHSQVFMVPDGVPDPAELWKLVRKQEIQVDQAPSEENGGIVHRPTISHYLYVLERTSTQLEASAVLELDARE